MIDWQLQSLEGRAEIYLKWKNVIIIFLMISVPLAIALLFGSWIIRVVCYLVSLSAYMSCRPIQGPCVMAIAIIILPWYLFIAVKSIPLWLVFIPVAITLIEINYIVYRIKFIKGLRQEQNVLS